MVNLFNSKLTNSFMLSGFKKKLSKTFFLFCFFLLAINNFGQNQKNTSTFFTPEILIGKTLEANTGFPKTGLQKAIFISFGKHNRTNKKEWATRLNYPKTGISLGITNFGNMEKLGRTYTVIPFMEFPLLKKRTQKLNLHIALGGAYADTQHNIITNPFNQAISTKINWSFRSFLYRNILKDKNADWRFGLGYIHYSNGHTKLPNQGLNSLLASISAKVNSNKEKNQPILEEAKKINTSQTYFSIRTGIGQNALSKIFNNKKEVYAFNVSAGKIINKTFKIGGGIYYRYYEQYYDYIKNEDFLIKDKFPFFKNKPFLYSSNLGFFATSELLIDHFGFEFDIGINIYKPFYQIAYQLSQGYSPVKGNQSDVALGELDWYYEFKSSIAPKLGLKYYLFSTNKTPKYNFFLGAHINANLGQADFTELSIGYVYRFD